MRRLAVSHRPRPSPPAQAAPIGASFVVEPRWRTCTNDPTALHLRAMNMLYEGLEQSAAIVRVRSTALDTMQLGGSPAGRRVPQHPGLYRFAGAVGRCIHGPDS
jgi:hypothetical protein